MHRRIIMEHFNNSEYPSTDMDSPDDCSLDAKSIRAELFGPMKNSNDSFKNIAKSFEQFSSLQTLAVHHGKVVFNLDPLQPFVKQLVPDTAIPPKTLALHTIVVDSWNAHESINPWLQFNFSVFQTPKDAPQCFMIRVHSIFLRCWKVTKDSKKKMILLGWLRLMIV